ncbi:MAG: hypothetical protein ACYCZB_12655 [Acidiphilium sp.]
MTLTLRRNMSTNQIYFIEGKYYEKISRNQVFFLVIFVIFFGSFSYFFQSLFDLFFPVVKSPEILGYKYQKFASLSLRFTIWLCLSLSIFLFFATVNRVRSVNGSIIGLLLLKNPVNLNKAKKIIVSRFFLVAVFCLFFLVFFWSDLYGYFYLYFYNHKVSYLYLSKFPFLGGGALSGYGWTHSIVYSAYSQKLFSPSQNGKAFAIFVDMKMIILLSAAGMPMGVIFYVISHPKKVLSRIISDWLWISEQSKHNDVKTKNY